MSIENDIFEQKSAIRQQMKAKRLQMPEHQKLEYEKKIFINITSSEIYQSAQLLFTYVSTEREVDTRQIIMDALSAGKRVAVPRILPQTEQMEFCLIDGLQELTVGAMGILEPKQGIQIATDFHNSICLVPALCFDKKGHRLGYGKGYYDRFLNEYSAKTVGLCFSSNLLDAVPQDEFDISVKIIVTEEQVLSVAK